DFLLGEFPLHLAERKGDVFKDVQMRPDGVGLKHHADVALVRRDGDAARGREDQIVADKNLSFVRLLQTSHGAQGRRLAAATGSEQGIELPRLHFEADAADGVHGAAVGLVAEMEIRNANHGPTICTVCRRKLRRRMTTESSISATISRVPMAATAGT